jgi:hypothetical protein
LTSHSDHPAPCSASFAEIGDYDDYVLKRSNNTLGTERRKERGADEGVSPFASFIPRFLLQTSTAAALFSPQSSGLRGQYKHQRLYNERQQ